MSETNRIFDHDQQRTWFQCCSMIATLVGRAVTVSRLHDADANAKVILKLEQGSPDANCVHLQVVDEAAFPFEKHGLYPGDRFESSMAVNLRCAAVVQQALKIQTTGIGDQHVLMYDLTPEPMETERLTRTTCHVVEKPPGVRLQGTQATLTFGTEIAMVDRLLKPITAVPLEALVSCCHCILDMLSYVEPHVAKTVDRKGLLSSYQLKNHTDNSEIVSTMLEVIKKHLAILNLSDKHDNDQLVLERHNAISEKHLYPQFSTVQTLMQLEHFKETKTIAGEGYASSEPESEPRCPHCSVSTKIIIRLDQQDACPSNHVHNVDEIKIWNNWAKKISRTPLLLFESYRQIFALPQFDLKILKKCKWNEYGIKYDSLNTSLPYIPFVSYSLEQKCYGVRIEAILINLQIEGRIMHDFQEGIPLQFESMVQAAVNESLQSLHRHCPAIFSNRRYLCLSKSVPSIAKSIGSILIRKNTEGKHCSESARDSERILYSGGATNTQAILQEFACDLSRKIEYLVAPMQQTAHQRKLNKESISRVSNSKTF